MAYMLFPTKFSSSCILETLTTRVPIHATSSFTMLISRLLPHTNQERKLHNLSLPIPVRSAFVSKLALKPLDPLLHRPPHLDAHIDKSVTCVSMRARSNPLHAKNNCKNNSLKKNPIKNLPNPLHQPLNPAPLNPMPLHALHAALSMKAPRIRAKVFKVRQRHTAPWLQTAQHRAQNRL